MRLCNIDSLRLRLCGIALTVAALLAGNALAAPPLQPRPDAQQSRTDMQSNDNAFDNDADNVKAVPLPWSRLNPDQRALFAPLQSQWDQLPPKRQQRMAAHAERWMQLPPERRAQLQQRLTHWAQMTPEQRRGAAQGERKFQAMPQADRQRVIDAYQRFQSLDPAQRKLLMQRFREQRRARQQMRRGGQSAPQH